MEKKITEILIDGQGWKYSYHGEIKPFKVNGEMAEVTWFRQEGIDGKTREWNSKYVIEIISETIDKE